MKRTEFERGGLAFHTMCAVFGDKGYLGDDSRKQFKVNQCFVLIELNFL